MDRCLKNYEKYLFSIKTLAAALRVKIEWRTEPSDGLWRPQARLIIIDPDLSESGTIATLLHELGHAIDDSSVDEKTSGKINASYSLIYTDIYAVKDVDVVSAAEIRAWNYGAAIAKNLGIPLGKWFDSHAKLAIKDYKKLSKDAS